MVTIGASSVKQQSSENGGLPSVSQSMDGQMNHMFATQEQYAQLYQALVTQSEQMKFQQQGFLANSIYQPRTAPVATPPSNVS